MRVYILFFFTSCWIWKEANCQSRPEAVGLLATMSFLQDYIWFFKTTTTTVTALLLQQVRGRGQLIYVLCLEKCVGYSFLLLYFFPSSTDIFLFFSFFSSHHRLFSSEASLSVIILFHPIYISLLCCKTRPAFYIFFFFLPDGFSHHLRQSHSTFGAK